MANIPYLTNPTSGETLFLVLSGGLQQTLTVSRAQTLLGTQGYTGSTGRFGYAGSQGYAGSIGYFGSQGYTGSTGYIGSQGYTGSTGYNGSRGYTGSLGYNGSHGYSGSIGYTGSRGIGYTGSASTAAGYAGSLGYTGSRGAGYTGSASTTPGYTGSHGYTGSAGYNGSIGYNGSMGYYGSLGYNGSMGYYGSQGILGYTGSAGTGASFNGGTITNPLIINNNTPSFSTTTGALQVLNGGVGIGGTLYSSEHYIVYDTSNAAYPGGYDAGLFITNTYAEKTGVTLQGVSGNKVFLANSGTNFYLSAGSSILDPTDPASGAQILTANTSNVRVVLTTPSVSTATGALIVRGGVGIGGSLYAGNIYSNGTLLTAGGGGGSVSIATPTTLGSVFAYTTSTGNNTSIGYCSGNTTMTGYDNFASGCYALFCNTTGVNNTAQGYRALRSNTTGSYNTAQGYNSLAGNTTGCNNIAQGYSSLRSNTTGCYNIAQGYSTLRSNTTGCLNVAQGYSALRYNINGSRNIGLGTSAGAAITTGNNNTVIGSLPAAAGCVCTLLLGAGTCERVRVDNSGLYINGSLFTGGTFSGGTITGTVLINNTTQSNSTTTGALTVLNGGVGIGGSLNATNITSFTASLTPGAAPGSPTAGQMAVSNGTTWNPISDGLQHLMIYLNNTWTRVV